MDVASAGSSVWQNAGLTKLPLNAMAVPGLTPTARHTHKLLLGLCGHTGLYGACVLEITLHLLHCVGHVRECPTLHRQCVDGKIQAVSKGGSAFD
eukprot:1159666-Pelagomonas_calceolata.AAC.6